MKQQLLTASMLKKIPHVGATEGTDPIVWAHFFYPFSDWDWYVIEYDPKKRLFYGLVNGFEFELGYFSRDELESIRVRGCGVERDTTFRPVKLSELRMREL